MKKYFVIFTVLLGLYTTENIQVSAHSDYEVKMSDQSILRSESIAEYLQKLESLIKKLLMNFQMRNNKMLSEMFWK